MGEVKASKRWFDVLVCLVTAPIWGVVLVLLIIVVWVTLGRPVFFVQKRVGMGEKPFWIIKLRTLMEGNSGNERGKNAVGCWLRGRSLDELPQLINVLRGEMSLVGPRPLLMEYLPRYTMEERRRHEVLPGITGWAQIHGRNAISWEEKLALDLEYVRNHNFWWDLMILVRTPRAILTAKGSLATGESTGPEFLGRTGGVSQTK